MKIGLVGYGGWGKIHAASIAALKGHSLAAIACRSEETAGQARKEHPQCHVTTDYRELLQDPDIGTIDIVVPTHLHVPVALEALEAGKNVLLEKPMAPTLEDGRRLLDTAKRSGRTVSLVHELRCSEQWAGIRKLVESGEIGEPRYALLNLFRFPYRSGSGGWRYRQQEVGSWVLEEPIHFIDLLLWYFEAAGDPLAVTAFTNTGADGLSRDFTAVFEFSSGAYGVISQTLSGFEHHQVVEIGGSEGAVRSLWSAAMDRSDKPEFSLTVQRKNETEPSPVKLSKPSGELFEIREYIKLALDGIEQGNPLYPPEKEFRLMELCMAAEQSAALGRRVEL